MTKLPRVAIALTMLCLCGCIPQGGTTDDEIKTRVSIHYKTGIKFLQEGKAAKAVRELLTAKKLKPNNPDIEHALGLAYQAQGHYDLALKQYKRALELDPKFSEVRLNMGTIYLIKAQFDEAIEQFKACLEDPLYKTPEKAHYNLGVAYFHKKRVDQAIKHYKKAVAMKPEGAEDYSHALYNLAFCYEEKKDYPNALQYYEKALEVYPDFKDALFRIGLIKKEMGLFKESAGVFKQLLKKDSENINAHYHLGLAYLGMKRPEEARKQLKLVAAVDPNGDLGREAKKQLNKLTNDRFRGIPKVQIEN
jgi:type IV pilus biogenesis/stability protein PilW